MTNIDISKIENNQDLIDYYFVELRQYQESTKLINEDLKNRVLVLALFIGICISIFLVDILQELNNKYLFLSFLSSMMAIIVCLTDLLFCSDELKKISNTLKLLEELYGSLNKINKVNALREQKEVILNWINNYRKQMKTKSKISYNKLLLIFTKLEVMLLFSSIGFLGFWKSNQIGIAFFMYLTAMVIFMFVRNKVLIFQSKNK